MSEPITIRASSFGELLDCAHRWEAKHLLGMRSVPSAAAGLGTAIHAGTATWDKARADEQDIPVSDASCAALTALRGQEIDWRRDDLSKTDAERIAVTMTARYCEQIKTKYVAVEATLKPMDVDVHGTVIRLTGTMDRARVAEGFGGVSIADIKTGKRAVVQGHAETRGHWPQVGIYEALWEHTSGAPVATTSSIIGISTGTEAKVAIGHINGARSKLIGTEESPGALEMVAMYLKAGLFPPNPKSQLCNARYCPRWATCRFHD